MSRTFSTASRSRTSRLARTQIHVSGEGGDELENWLRAEGAAREVNG